MHKNKNNIKHYKKNLILNLCKNKLCFDIALFLSILCSLYLERNIL